VSDLVSQFLGLFVLFFTSAVRYNNLTRLFTGALMFSYPLTLSFKLLALAPQIKITDANGQTILYVRQKLLALKEDIKIFADEQQQTQLYQIKADRVIDFSAQYNIATTSGAAVGAIKRQGMRSLWKATFDLKDTSGAAVGLIHEENPWIKVLDALVSDIPFVGMFINPAYLIDLRGQTMLYLKKQPALFEGRFTLEKRADFSEADERLLVSSVIMMLLLERMRG